MPKPRFLAPQARRGDGFGYTNEPARQLEATSIHVDEFDTIARIAEQRAMCDEPEAVGPAVVDAYTDLARTYDLIRHSAEVEAAHQARQLLTVEQRMVNARRRSKLQHVDFSHELHVAQQMFDRARKGGRVEPPAALNRLAQVEARLDYRPDLDNAA